MKMLPTTARQYGRRPTARARVDERVHAGIILPDIQESSWTVRRSYQPYCTPSRSIGEVMRVRARLVVR